MVSTSLTISVQALSVGAFQRERQTYAVAILNSPDTFKSLFACVVTSDANVISDATQAGTVVLTTGNTAAQAALVTDAHINTAVGNSFNAFFRVPAS